MTSGWLLQSLGTSHASKPLYDGGFFTDTGFQMTDKTIANVTLALQANVYFEGKCVSHSFVLADGSKKSVGVILPATLTFSTGAPEVMECVAGSCQWRMPGDADWQVSEAGERFSVPGNSRFEIRVSEPYHYICHLG
jgi:uncharacterized protein YaiE (UPF0345 family)